MRIAVIGGTKLIGPSLVEQLVNLNHEIICINRTGINPISDLAIKCDRNNKIQLEKALVNCKADLLIDMIPFITKQAKDLSEILDKLNIPLIAISSIDVYQAFNIIWKTVTVDYQKCPIKENGALRQKLSIQGKSYNKL